MSPSWRFPALIVGILLLCSCLVFCVAAGGLVWMQSDNLRVISLAPSTPTLQRTSTRLPTEIPRSTSTPAPTYTLVIQRGTLLPPPGTTAKVTPTRPSPYRISVPTPTASAPDLTVRYDTQFSLVTYDVTGKTVNEISKSLESNAIPDPHDLGSRFYARTDWSLAGKWSTRRTAQGCQVESGSVAVAVTMTLPVLVSNVQRSVRTRWDGFIANTITHEDGHVKRVYDGGRTYQLDLSRFPPAASCDIIQAQLDALFRKELDQIDRTNVDYDNQTKHGESQGATFP